MEHERYDPVRRYPPHEPLAMINGSAAFLLLELILDPTRTPPPPMQNAILMTIDIESRFVKSIGKKQITQIGVVSLDTRALRDVDTSDSESLVNAVQSRMFSIYPKRASPRAWYPKTLWTEPERIKHHEICEKLKEVFSGLSNSSVPEVASSLSLQHSTSHGESRNIILIGHSIHHDRTTLNDLLGFDIKYVPSIKAIIDTSRMVRCAYDLGKRSHSLYDILRYLGVHYDQTHDAANDAMFTMKALLLIFSNWKHQKGRHLWNVAEDVMLMSSCSQQAISFSTDIDLLWECQLEVLAAIAREPWPTPRKPAGPYRSMMPKLLIKRETDLLLSVEELESSHLFS